MILLVLIFIIFIFSIKKGKSITSLLCILYLCSLVGLFFMSPSHFFNSNLRVWDICFLIFFYVLLIAPWSKFKLENPIELKCSDSDLCIYRFYKKTGIICFVINIIVFYILSKVVTDYSAYKNLGERSDAISYLPVSNNILLILTWYSYTYLLMLPFHFYFLTKGNIKESLISFVVSGNFILSGLTSFSRSSSVSFALVYIILFIYFKKNINVRLAKKMRFVILIFIVGIVSLFYSITMNRFGGDNDYVNDSFIYNDAVLKDKIINSQLSYFSEWYIHTDKWLPTYQNNDLSYGSRTFPVVAMFLSKFGITDKYPDSLNKMMYHQFKNDQFTFLGIATSSVFDLGLIATCLLVFIYFFILQTEFVNRKCNIKSIMLLVLLIQIPSTGIFNSVLNTIGWHFSLLLYFVFSFYRKNSDLKLKRIF